MNKLNIYIIFLVILSMIRPAFSQESKPPKDYLRNFVKNEKVFWVGKVVDINIYQSNKEITIEWLCEYLELEKPIDINLYLKTSDIKYIPPTILVRKSQKQYFVSTFRSPDMPLEVAQNSTKGMVAAGTYIIRDSATSFIGKFKDKEAIYIGGGRGTISSNIKVKYVN